jgi:putative transposase
LGGGLTRSMGGWSEVLSLRRKETQVASDERILGSSEFILGLFSEAEQRMKETLRFSGKVKDLSSLAREVAKGEGITEEDMRSGSRQRQVSKARRLFCHLAVREMRHLGAEVARFLGVTTSAINRLANSDKMQ